MILRSCLVSFLLLLSAITVNAQGMMTSDSLEIRNKLELEVQKNILQLVSTQLDPHTFTVAVRANLAPIQPPKPEEKKNAETLPPGMDLGSIDVRELLHSYEKQIEELKLKKEQKKDLPPQFQLKSMEVIVGLDKTYGDEYTKKFELWIKNRMKSDYGSLVKATVSPVEFKKGNDPNQPGVPADDTTPLWKSLLPLASAFLITLALIILGRALKSGMNQIATATKPLSLEPKGPWSLERNQADEENSESESADDPLALDHVNTSEFERLISKIAFVCLEINDRVNDLVRVWMDSGDEGFMKTALLIDTLVNAREKIMAQTGAIPQFRIPIDEELVKSREENLAEAFRNTSNMMIHEKNNLLEVIYWDLVSCRTLGLQSLRRPFDFLHGMAKENVVELLKTQKDDAKALAIVYLPTEVQNQVINEFEESKKVDLIHNMLLQSQISQKQIWDLDTSVKVSTINQSAHPEEKLVNLFPRTVEVLESLNPIDEIKILRMITPQLPDSGLTVKQQYSSLSFIDEWKLEYVKKLAQVATSDEILALIRQIPSIQNTLLEQCPPKVKTIVEDDLKISTSADPNSIAQKLSSLKAKWNRIVVNENLPMTKVLEPKRIEVLQNVA